MTTATELLDRIRIGRDKIAEMKGRNPAHPGLPDAEDRLRDLNEEWATEQERYKAEREARERRDEEREQAAYEQEQAAKEPKEKKPKPKARWRNGKRSFYRGARRDRSLDPRWDRVPTAVRESVLEGNLQPADMIVAWVLYDHVRRHKGEGRRITVGELVEMMAKTGRSHSSAERSLRRLQLEKVIEVEAAGTGNQRGALYRFPGRATVA